MFDGDPYSATANSYLTVLEADEFLLEGRLFADLWTAATEANKEKALRWATYLFDTLWTWDGAKLTTNQPLQFPRTDASGTDIGVPMVLKRSVAEVAMLLTEQDLTKPLALHQKGFRRAKADVLEIELDKKFVPMIFPRHIEEALDDYGTLDYNPSATTRIVDLGRG